jgi:hypothetical protein
MKVDALRNLADVDACDGASAYRNDSSLSELQHLVTIGRKKQRRSSAAFTLVTCNLARSKRTAVTFDHADCDVTRQLEVSTDTMQICLYC